MIDEQKLLHKLKKKDRGSLEKIIKRYTPYVSAVVYHTIGGAAAYEDIEEVISDAFIALWKNAAAIDEEKGSMRSYLGAIARNAARNRNRRF